MILSVSDIKILIMINLLTYLCNNIKSTKVFKLILTKYYLALLFVLAILVLVGYSI